MSRLLLSASPRPFVTNGMAVSAPVVVVCPVPSRLNHVSTVNVAAPRLSAWPNVTYSLPGAVPLRCSPYAPGDGEATNGAPPLTHTGPAAGASAPLLTGEVTMLLVATVPVPSSSDQRPARFGSDAIGMPIVDWMSACVRATFQMRGSSICPWNAPVTTPVELIAAPSAAC